MNRVHYVKSAFMNKQRYIDELMSELDSLKRYSLYRESKTTESALDFTSNDYLGLRSNKSRGLTSPILGASASRVLSGTCVSHLNLENAISRYIGSDSALLFGSGYLANIGTLSALLGRKDLVFSDKYSHRSLLEGIQLSGAKHSRFRHNDLAHLESMLIKADKSRAQDQNIFIVTESVFSMDGDLAPLKEISSLSKQYKTLLIVDEAHAFGVYGNGRCIEEGIFEDTLAVLGTCSKAFSGYGGFFAGSKVIRDYLINKASSFIYSTALPPALCDVLIDNIKFIEESSEPGRRALENAEFFRQQLKLSGAYEYCSVILDSQSNIVPFVLGEEERVLKLKNSLAEENVLVAAIRPPTIPKGTSRIRFSIRADHEREDLRRVAYLVSDILAGT